MSDLGGEEAGAIETYMVKLWTTEGPILAFVEASHPDKAETFLRRILPAFGVEARPDAAAVRALVHDGPAERAWVLARGSLARPLGDGPESQR